MKSTAIRAAWYLASFIIPICIVLCVFLSLNLYPFGSNTISNWDLRYTYTYFFEWYKNVLEGNGSILYSFSKSLGGNMFAGWASLCASPLNLLILLFPGKNPMPFVTFVTVIRFGLAGTTALYYLRHRFELDHFHALALSICYSLMLFMTTEYLNPMWIDAIVVLPITMLGVYKLVRRSQTSLLFTSLLSTIIIDWYNGYMACLFAVLLYLFESYIYEVTSNEIDQPIRLGFMSNVGKFAVTYTLAISASFVVLLPTALCLLGGKGAVPSNLFNPDLRFSLPEAMRSFFFGIYEKEHLPQLFTGSFALVCTVWFLFNGHTSTKERLAAFFLLAIILFSTWFAPFDRIWCGFRDGNSFYCRYAYIGSAILMLISGMCLEKWRTSDDRHSLAPVAFGLITIAIVILASGHYNNMKTFLLTIVFIGCFSGLLAIKSSYYRAKLRAVISVLLIILVSFEMFLSAQKTFQFCTPSPADSSIERYDTYFSEGSSQFEELDKNDNSELNDYRVTKLHTFLSNSSRIISNESLVYGYSQIAQYDSCYDDCVQNLMSSLGYSSEWMCMTTYYNPVLPADSLLGVRYTSASKCPPGFTDPQFSATQDGNRFYENPYALPFGFFANRSIVDTTIPTEPDTSPEKNPFEYQNAFFKALTGIDKNCFNQVKVSLTSNGAKEKTWSFKLPSSDLAYGYLSCNPNTDLRVVDDKGAELVKLDKWIHGIFPIAKSNTSREQLITLCPPDPQAFEGNLGESDVNLLVYTFDMDVFLEMRNALLTSTFVLDEFKDGYVKGTCKSSKDGVLFTTIPQDRGWTVRVNGRKVQYEIAQNTFIVIPVEQGTNEITMSYIPPGLIEGLAISGLSIALYIALLLFRQRKLKRDEGEVQQENPSREDGPHRPLFQKRQGLSRGRRR